MEMSPKLYQLMEQAEELELQIINESSVNLADDSLHINTLFLGVRKYYSQWINLFEFHDMFIGSYIGYSNGQELKIFVLVNELNHLAKQLKEQMEKDDGLSVELKDDKLFPAATLDYPTSPAYSHDSYQSILDVKKRVNFRRPCAFKHFVLEFPTDVCNGGVQLCGKPNVKCGSSINRLCEDENIGGGTLGCFVEKENGDVCLLSNEHVLAFGSTGSFSEQIIYPSPEDLHEYPQPKSIVIGNYLEGKRDNVTVGDCQVGIDAAIAKLLPDLIEPSNELELNLDYWRKRVPHKFIPSPLPFLKPINFYTDDDLTQLHKHGDVIRVFKVGKQSNVTSGKLHTTGDIMSGDVYQHILKYQNRSKCRYCPITFQLFDDPLLAADGHTYERKAIVEWIKLKGASPINRERIKLKDLRSNLIVKELVDEYRSSLPYLSTEDTRDPSMISDSGNHTLTTLSGTTDSHQRSKPQRFACWPFHIGYYIEKITSVSNNRCDLAQPTQN
ncbi:unnamed protein product [Didymodactylos carnosus]|uniref:U-box domain-containing protein n=1 Tax=Didymodactylos carnosus TaxID=1234261 RepID=A0A814V5R3_9BILA|nr:unnamed protein product [Didymodactylos carnosus]CAF3947816.1 unnamed protein product [Didymodactylos carnosus]